MNKNLNLAEILKDCPKGTKFYSTIFGEVEFYKIRKESEYPIVIITKHGNNSDIKSDGRYYGEYDDGECTLFPSKDQRDWSKFTAPWYKKDKFDPKTLQPFDKVLARVSDESYTTWYADFVAEPAHAKNETPLILGVKEANMVIPYNADTKHLVGTNEDAPDYYRYWED